MKLPNFWDPTSCWSVPWVRQAAASQQPPLQPHASYYQHPSSQPAFVGSNEPTAYRQPSRNFTYDDFHAYGDHRFPFSEQQPPDPPPQYVLPSWYSSIWWYFLGENQQPIGPYPFATLQELHSRGYLTNNSLVWAAGYGDWQSLTSVLGFSPGFVPVRADNDTAFQQWQTEVRRAAVECDHPPHYSSGSFVATSEVGGDEGFASDAGGSILATAGKGVNGAVYAKSGVVVVDGVTAPAVAEPLAHAADAALQAWAAMQLAVAVVPTVDATWETNVTASERGATGITESASAEVNDSESAEKGDEVVNAIDNFITHDSDFEMAAQLITGHNKDAHLTNVLISEKLGKTTDIDVGQAQQLPALPTDAHVGGDELYPTAASFFARLSLRRDGITIATSTSFEKTEDEYVCKLVESLGVSMGPYITDLTDGADLLDDMLTLDQIFPVAIQQTNLVRFNEVNGMLDKSFFLPSVYTFRPVFYHLNINWENRKRRIVLRKQSRTNTMTEEVISTKLLSLKVYVPGCPKDSIMVGRTFTLNLKVPDVGHDSVLVTRLYLSGDPYIRSGMGDFVWGMVGREEYNLIKSTESSFNVQVTDGLLSPYTGILGQLVGQLASLLGSYVVGSTRTLDTMVFLRATFGFDDAFTYEEVVALNAAFKRNFPEEIDVYFKNVGGSILGAVLFNMQLHGRMFAQGVREPRKNLMGEDFIYVKDSFATGTLHFLGLLSDGGVHSLKRGLKPYVMCYNILIGRFLNKRDYGSSTMSWEKLTKDLWVYPSVVMYNVLILGLCMCGRFRDDLEVWDMTRQNDRKMTLYAYNALIHGLCEFGNIDTATNIYQEMVESKISPNYVLYNAMLHGFFRAGRITDYLRLWELMAKESARNVSSFDIMMKGLFHHDDVDTTISVWELVPESGFVAAATTREILVRGLCENGYNTKSLNFLTTAEEKGGVLDCHAYSAMITGLCKEGKLNVAASVLHGMVKGGHMPHSHVSLALMCYTLPEETHGLRYLYLLEGKEVFKGGGVDTSISSIFFEICC